TATQSIPIVVVTADAYKADIDHAYQVGADVVLPKPCLPQELLARIQRCLAQSARLRQRSERTLATARLHVARSQRIRERVRECRAHRLSRIPNVQHTNAPPSAPPVLACEHCGRALIYEYSHVGTVALNEIEQWDYYRCSKGCGTFQHQHRSRQIRRLT